MGRTTKTQVLGRLDYMNKFTSSAIGEEYSASYCPHYGGWDLYIKDNKSRIGRLGFDYRKTTPEFMAYMTGVINAICAIKNK